MLYISFAVCSIRMAVYLGELRAEMFTTGFSMEFAEWRILSKGSHFLCCASPIFNNKPTF
jgi:hypothetical protein